MQPTDIAQMATHHLALHGLDDALRETMARLWDAHGNQLTEVDKIIPLYPDDFKGPINIDGHIWLELPTGATYDPTLEAGLKEHMEAVAKQNGLPIPVELVYKEFNGDLKKQVWERVWKFIIKREIRLQREQGVTKARLFEELAAQPRLHQCVLNSWTRHVVLKEIGIKTRVCIGSLGILKNDGTVFWEYG